jgi:hypothetical protein
MHQGRRIAAVLAIATVSTIAEAAAAPALSVGPVSTSVTTAPEETVAPLTATVPNVPAPTVTSVSPPPVVSSTPTVSPTTAPSSGGSGGGGSGGGGSPVSGVVDGVKQSLSGGGSSGSSGGGGGTVSGVVNGAKQSLPAVNGAKPSTGSAGAVVGGATGGGYSTPGSGSSAVSPVFGGTPGGPGGGFSGPAGFGGPGGSPGAGGPGSPAAFALGIQRGTVTGNGSGGVSAFAAAVGSLAGCFYALTPFEQQVLTVRTGIDGRQALSRNQLAALLGTSPAAIGATERNALGELRKAARTDGCMPVGGVSVANALTAFIGGPFGPIGYVTPAVPPESRAAPGSNADQQTRLATTSFVDKLAMLDNANGQASMSVLVIIAVMLSGALAALVLEARRSVH